MPVAHKTVMLMKLFFSFIKDESGATAIEYGLLCALIVIGIVASIQTIGTSYVAGPLNNVQTHLSR